MIWYVERMGVLLDAMYAYGRDGRYAMQRYPAFGNVHRIRRQAGHLHG